MMKEVLLKAFAKINIGLKVISKRPDGYHNIETIFQEIDLYDVIKIRRETSPGIQLRSQSRHIPLDENNICHKAISLFQELSNDRFGVELEIEKNIPVGAGLGGGSSNAAATLLGLQKLSKNQLDDNQLFDIARRIGADVPFFLKGGTALASGIGDQIKKISLPFNFYCVLIYPNIEISTPWVYKNFNFNLTKSKKIIKLSRIIHNRSGLFELRKFVDNDLEDVVFKKHPELGDFKNTLYEKGAFLANMSGSGSTIFGLFERVEDAEGVVKDIPKSCQIFLAQPKIAASIINLR